MRRLVALALLVGVARADEAPVVESEAPPPAKAAAATWSWPGGMRPVVVLSEEHAMRVAARLQAIEEERDRALEKAAKAEAASHPTWKWWFVIGAIAGAGAVYYGVRR